MDQTPYIILTNNSIRNYNGDKPSVVSRAYRYDRVKQGILDYHVGQMLEAGNIIPIQFRYASPVVLCRKNNGLPPDNLEAYRFVVDYRKLKAITKYPRYPLPLIEDLITSIPHTPQSCRPSISVWGTFNLL
ncbi:retrovirus-related Pol polyprotein from transposon 17.6 [Trichonephila clavipes]|nr:retrovirus-related Pol polyprotein from transposon 17.6 [Trichonephila clavipes]